MSSVRALSVFASALLFVCHGAFADEVPTDGSAAERVMNRIRTGVAASDEEISALLADDTPASRILGAVAAEHAAASNLAERASILEELAPVSTTQATVSRRYDAAAAVTLSLGLAAFVVQNVFSRLSDAALAAYDDSDAQADLDSARRLATGSFVAAGLGVAGFGISVPLLALGGPTSSPVADVPRELAALWWESDPPARAAALRLERDRALRSLETTRRSRRSYAVGTIVSGSAGVLATALTVVAIIRGSDFYGRYQTAEFSNEAESLRRNVEAQQTIATVSGTVGAVGVGTMVALIVSRPNAAEIEAQIERLESQIDRIERAR